MFLSLGTLQIMWKEIGIFIICLFLMSNLIAIYIVETYKKIIKLYDEGDVSEALKKKAKKHLEICDFYSIGPCHKNRYLMFNELCSLLASIALVEKNEDEFLYYMNRIKKENEYERKAFILALYYRSKRKYAVAKKWYENYLTFAHHDMQREIVLKGIFETEEKNIEFYSTVKQFKNPAILQLFKDNGIEISEV